MKQISSSNEKWKYLKENIEGKKNAQENSKESS